MRTNGAKELSILRRTASILFAGFILFLSACQPKSAESAFGLRTADLKISSAPLTAEIADTPEASENGLMFRDSLPEDRGMLFVCDADAPKRATFWMKNTKIPLSIAFIDSAGTILEVKSMYPMDETIVPSNSTEVAYALEVNQGWFERHKISPGDKIGGIPRR